MDDAVAAPDPEFAAEPPAAVQAAPAQSPYSAETNPDATFIGDVLERSGDLRLPLIGYLPLQQQVRFLLVLLGGSLLLGAFFVWLNANNSILTFDPDPDCRRCADALAAARQGDAERDSGQPRGVQAIGRKPQGIQPGSVDPDARRQLPGARNCAGRRRDGSHAERYPESLGRLRQGGRNHPEAAQGADRVRHHLAKIERVVADPAGIDRTDCHSQGAGRRHAA